MSNGSRWAAALPCGSMSDPAPGPLPALPDDWERALCVVAHPDDLEYGVAAAVARWTSEGRQVSYLLATRGEAGIDALDPEVCGPLREAEERASAAAVGVEVVEFLGHRDGVLEAGLPLRRDLARAIRRHRPELLVGINFRLTFGGTAFNMADHRTLGLAALDAARDAGNRWIFPELADEGLEPWGGTRRAAFGGSTEPTHGVDVTGFVDRGIASLLEHRAYLEHLGDAFDAPAFLTGSAEQGGLLLGTAHAVTFEVIDL
jgi:LmbE family N-acetylglucosaminyl deacetylase